MFESASLRHIPALIAGFSLTFGGIIPLFNARRAMLDLGFSPRVANSPTAVPPMMIFGSRTTMIGVLVLMFYSQKKFEAVDSVLLTIPYAGFVDGYLVWKDGQHGKAIFRVVTGLLFGACGLGRLTASNS